MTRTSRYCEMCDTWTKKRDCPACGFPTRRAIADEPHRESFDEMSERIRREVAEDEIDEGLRDA